MKKIHITALLLLFAFTVGFGQKPDAWDQFARTKFEPKYYEKFGEYLFYPTFTPELKALVGKEVTVQGYFVPFAPEDGDYVVISKFPMSQCYFCGGGGPESIAEVNFLKGQSKFQVDDLITVRGKLKLNADDMDHVNFILTDAVLIPD
jgi:hypothetical protein